MKTQTGKFITFEGPEGGGKSTHIRLLADALAALGIGTVLTREPGGTPLGEAVRGLLQRDDPSSAPVPGAEVLLFLASRAQHVERLIRPALAAGKWVLCDRFDDSTFAYQGAGRGFPLPALKRIDAFATGGLKPDFTLLLDLPPELSRKRLAEREAATASRPDRIEAEDLAFHTRLRDCFLKLASAEPARFAVIDTDRDRALVAADIAEAVKRHFGLAGEGRA